MTQRQLLSLLDRLKKSNPTELNLFSIELTTLPAVIGELTTLQSLDLGDNQLTTLPKAVGKLTNLQSLSLHNNELTTLPDAIGELTTLQTLYLGYNELTTLPDAIGKLITLQTLYLFNNQLTTLPEAIVNLTNLQSLDLSDNYLTSLPDAIGNLTNLQTFNLDNNQLTTLPDSLMALAEEGTLTGLYLHGNDGLGIPPEIFGATWEDVTRNKIKPADPREILRYYFAQRRAGTARPLNEAKVLFIGEAEVGKSSLIAALTEGPLRRDFDKTRGIVRNVWWPEGKGEGALRLNLWDFGGQEVYHATHTFFLTERAVYVVVVNARDNDAQNNIEYWLQMARSFGGENASILVAINKCDQHHDGPDQHLLRRKYGNDLRFIRTSCWQGTGLEELKKAIHLCVNDDPEVRREIPAAWIRIKDALECMTEETLPLEEYRALCIEHGETDEQNQNLLLDLWHKLGAVLYFHHHPDDPPEIGDLGILNPEWVTRGVYAVLDAPVLRDRDGVLTDRQLRDALKEAQYTGGSPHFIEAMMRKFELLYDAPDRQPHTMLVPRLLAENEPAFAWPPTGETLRFVYRYEVLPAGLLPRFIVRRHQLLSKSPKPWRHGCVLEIESCRVLVRSDREAKTVEILVDGSPLHRREALDRVRLTFDDIHGTIKDLPVEELIPVPGHPDAPLLSYTFFRDLEAEGKAETQTVRAANRGVIEVNIREALGLVRNESRREKDQKSNVFLPGDKNANPKREKNNARSAKTTGSPARTMPTKVPFATDFVPLLDTNSFPDNERHLQNLLGHVRSVGIVPFVGAGLSLPFGFPLWGKFLRDVVNTPLYSTLWDASALSAELDNDAYETVADAVFSKLTPRVYQQVMARYFGKSFTFTTPPYAVEHLATIAHGPVITTNFDRVLEEVYTLAGKPFTTKSYGAHNFETALSSFDASQYSLLKIHGDYNDPVGRVLTQNEYATYYGGTDESHIDQNQPLPQLLAKIFAARKPFLFLGCSLETDRTMLILKQLAGKQLNPLHFALLEMKDTARWMEREEFLLDHLIAPIWYPKGEHFWVERILRELAESAPH